MRIAAIIVSLLLPLAIHASSELKSDDDPASKNVENYAPDGEESGIGGWVSLNEDVDSDYELVESKEHLKYTENTVAQENEAPNTNFLSIAWSYVFGAPSTGVNVELPEDQVSQLMELLDMSDMDIAVFKALLMNGTGNASNLLATLSEQPSAVIKMAILLRYNRKLYDAFVERNKSAIIKSLGKSDFTDIVATLVCARSYDFLEDVMRSKSFFMIEADKFVIALLSLDVNLLFEVFNNSFNHIAPSHLDWKSFNIKKAPETMSECAPLVKNFALESCFALVNPDHVGVLLAEGANPNHNNFACLKVAAKNRYAMSFKLLAKNLDINIDLAAELLQIALSSGCHEIALYLIDRFGKLTVDISPDAFILIKNSGNAKLIEATKSCPISLTATNFVSVLKKGKLSDEELLNIVCRRSPRSTLKFKKLFTAVALANKSELFVQLLKTPQVIDAANPDEMSHILNWAVKKGYTEALELFADAGKERFNDALIDTLEIIKSTPGIIYKVATLGLRWTLTNPQSDKLVEDKEWAALTAYARYANSSPLGNHIRILNAARKINRNDYIDAWDSKPPATLTSRQVPKQSRK